ncbi:hypothetical protein [Bacillus chungangensis]|uniref:Uncharacterized protein n=1 Tax=Bacillus chungangensis TaxID=587633 RepID=A0ABT9WUX5_9BACI|nr:hypothetical protein [Bacillus chungangensis]MDQ0177014.1 hypothetical protein [Bacillus chungangensis]
MKQIVHASRKKTSQQERLAVLRLELDYELAVLFEAMQESNEEQKELSKQKLKKIRMELLKLRAL